MNCSLDHEHQFLFVEKIFEPPESEYATGLKKKKKTLYYDETLDKQYKPYDHEAAASYHYDDDEKDEKDDKEGKVKGWRESGYKIVTEVEYNDKGENNGDVSLGLATAFHLPLIDHCLRKRSFSSSSFSFAACAVLFAAQGSLCERPALLAS